jgi:hypothetical protein
MAAVFVGVGLVALIFALELQKIAISNTRSMTQVPLLGASARCVASPLYVPTVRIIGVACLGAAVLLIAVATG